MMIIFEYADLSLRLNDGKNSTLDGELFSPLYPLSIIKDRHWEDQFLKYLETQWCNTNDYCKNDLYLTILANALKMLEGIDSDSAQ